MNNTGNFYIRNAHNNDFQAVHRLLSLKSTKFLGNTKRKIFDPEIFFEMYCTHCMVVKNHADDENIIGYAEIKHFPKIPTLPRDSWMDWLSHHYCVNLPISLSNALFINFLIYDVQFCPDLILAILSEVFFREHCVRFIMSVEPPYRVHKFKEDEPDYTVFDKYSKTYFPKDFSASSCKNTQKLRVIFRDDIIPPMRFRKALPEDNDEIVEIIDQENPLFKKQLGDYYIAEELLADTLHKTLIVTEVNNQTVGFIWLNININTIKLIKNFELDSYENLLKFTPDDYWKIMTHDYHDLVRNSNKNLFTISAIRNLYNEDQQKTDVFPLRGETSSISVYSHFSLPVLVNSDSSSTVLSEMDNEFIKREEVFRKFKLLEERLKSTDWYIERVKRTFRVQYNSYYGINGEIIHSNAFILQLYGLHSSNDFRKVHQFLIAAFSSQPERDYCIFNVPHSWNLTTSLRELLHYFVRVIPRPDCEIDDVLYITHRASVMGDISVHNIQQEDIAQLKALLLYDPTQEDINKKTLYETQRKSKRNRSFQRKNTAATKVGTANDSPRQSLRPNASKPRISTDSPRRSGQRMDVNPSNQRISVDSSRRSSQAMNNKTSTQRMSTESPRASRKPLSVGLSNQRMDFQVPNASNERKSSATRSRSPSLKPILSKHSKFLINTTETQSDAPKEKPRNKTSSELEVEILDQILNEVLTNEFSDYRIVKICVGDSTRSIKDNVIVGFAIIRRFQQGHLLHKHYIIPECDLVRKYCRGEIVMLKLHPLFRFDSDFIFREIARITDFWDFFYIQPIKSNYIPLSNDLITKMQPVEPRREKKKFYREAEMIAFHSRLSISALSSLHLTFDYFALYQHNLRPTKYFESKDEIVIIGFNSFTRAFLRLHIFYFNYKSNFNTNMHCCVPQLKVTVITPPGVFEAEHEHFFECEHCANQTDCYVNSLNQNAFISDVSHRMDLSKYVKFINGNVQSIDRKERKVYVDNNCGISYDRLLIFASLLFGPPKHIALDEKLPPNYQQINNRFDKIIAYHKLQALHESLQNTLPKIVVFGAHLHAFEFMTFLLKHGAKGESISFVMPLYTFVDTEFHLNNPYCDRFIEKILLEMVEDLHITVYDNVKFSHWTCYPNNGNIESISFNKYDADESKHVLTTLSCDLFVSFLEAKTYTSMVDVFKEANIRMDGELILIDDYFRTSDLRILAFGRNTAPIVTLNHQTRYANAREVAEKIMKIIALPLDEKFISIDEKFRQPSLCKVQLPFDYNMIKIIAPKLYLENHLTNEYIRPLTTYKDNDFSRIRLNQHGFVEEIVVITQKTIDLDFLEFFCGKHEKLLNNLFLNWKLKYIASFLEFFQEPWTELIMHDHFSELRETNRELTMDTMNDILTYKKDFDRQSRQTTAHRRLADMGIPSDMEEHLFSFLRKYRKDFYFSFALPEDFSH